MTSGASSVFLFLGSAAHYSAVVVCLHLFIVDWDRTRERVNVPACVRVSRDIETKKRQRATQEGIRKRATRQERANEPVGDRD